MTSVTDTDTGHCFCPHCGTDQQPNRTIGVEIWGVYDGILFWRCPDCGGSWHRWSMTEHSRLYEKAAKYVGPPRSTQEALTAWETEMGFGDG